MVSSDRSPLSFLPTEAEAQVSPPPPYPTPQDLPQPLLQQPHAQEPAAQQPQAAPSLPQSDFQLLVAQVSPTRNTRRRERLGRPEFQAKWSPPSFLKGSSLTSFFPDVSFEQQSMRPGPAFTQQVSGRQGLPLPRSRNCHSQASSVRGTHTKQTRYCTPLTSGVLSG